MLRVVQRLDAEPVARCEQPPLTRVPEKKREHADEAIEARVAPFLVRGQDDLGIGSASIWIVMQL
jgi:hypothetical protein